MLPLLAQMWKADYFLHPALCPGHSLIQIVAILAEVTSCKGCVDKVHLEVRVCRAYLIQHQALTWERKEMV